MSVFATASDRSACSVNLLSLLSPSLCQLLDTMLILTPVVLGFGGWRHTYTHREGGGEEGREGGREKGLWLYKYIYAQSYKTCIHVV